jgi:phosphoglycolate phosphatase-like HAD superfamily hydrolase
MKTGVKVICFDFDGTIAATMPFLTELAVDVLTKHCRLEPEYARAEYIRTTGLPFADQAERICSGRGAAVQAAVAEFEDRKASEYFRMVPETHARETLQALKERGYTVAISSSTEDHLIRQYLSRFGLSPDLAMGLRPNFKKGRDHFNHIRHRYRIDSGAICYVADSLTDYRLATSLGVQFIAKSGLFDSSSFRALDPNMVVITDLKELLTIF